MTTDDLRRAIDDPVHRAQVPATELVEALLARIAELDSQVGAYFTVTEQLALADARRVDADRARGRRSPLDGMPIAVKDNIDVGGVRCTVASRLFQDRVARTDAEVVRRLRAAGGVILGKVALHELVYGATCTGPFFPQCHNPWDLSRIPGGSSGGSGAALAADLCIGALGSDTGGSVRVPAHLNGVTGLRPTFGTVSTRGAFPIAPTFDTIGPMARAARDVALLYAAVAAPDPADARSVQRPIPDVLAGLDDDIAGVRIGIPRDFFWDGLDDGIEAPVRALGETLEELGAVLVDVTVPGVAEAQEICTKLIRAEALAIHAEDLSTRPDAFSADTTRRLRLGAELTGVDIVAITQRMYEIRRDVRGLLGAEVDLLLTPAAPAAAPPIEGAEMISTTARLTHFAYPWSVAGLPSIALPCRLTTGGLPVGAQLAASPWRDGLVLRVGAAVQRATDWHLLRPPAPTLAMEVVST